MRRADRGESEAQDGQVAGKRQRRQTEKASRESGRRREPLQGEGVPPPAFDETGAEQRQTARPGSRRARTEEKSVMAAPLPPLDGRFQENQRKSAARSRAQAATIARASAIASWLRFGGDFKRDLAVGRVRAQECDRHSRPRASPPARMGSDQSHWPDATEACSISHLALKPPLGGRPMSDNPPRAMVRKVRGSTRAAPPSLAIWSWPSASASRPAEKNIAALAKAWARTCIRPRAPADRAPGMRAGSEREDQKQVADLGDGRIGDQQFQPRLTQSEDAANDDRRRAEPAENCGYLVRGKAGKHIKPQPQRQEERAFDDKAGEYGARGRRRVGVSGRQPEVQREKSRLGEQARGHQARPPSTRPAWPEPVVREAECPASHRRRRTRRRRADSKSIRTARTADSATRRRASPDGHRCKRGARRQKVSSSSAT